MDFGALALVHIVALQKCICSTFACAFFGHDPPDPPQRGGLLYIYDMPWLAVMSAARHALVGGQESGKVWRKNSDEQQAVTTDGRRDTISSQQVWLAGAVLDDNDSCV